MPAMAATPELHIAVDDVRKFAVIDAVCARLSADGADMQAIDGARVTTADGWWLLRASNTQAALVARAESTNAEGLARLIAQIDSHLLQSGLDRLKI